MDDIGIQPPEMDNSQLIEENTIRRYNVPLTRPNWYLRFFIPEEGSNIPDTNVLSVVSRAWPLCMH